MPPKIMVHKSAYTQGKHTTLMRQSSQLPRKRAAQLAQRQTPHLPMPVQELQKARQTNTTMLCVEITADSTSHSIDTDRDACARASCKCTNWSQRVKDDMTTLAREEKSIVKARP